MRTWILHPWTVALAVVVIGLAGICYSLWSFAENFGACKTVEEQSIPSPNGKNRVVIFRRECNATVPFNTQLSISPAAGRFSPEANPPFLTARANADITAAWLSDAIVETTLPGDAAVFRQERSVGAISIRYK